MTYVQHGKQVSQVTPARKHASKLAKEHHMAVSRETIRAGGDGNTIQRAKLALQLGTFGINMVTSGIKRQRGTQNQNMASLLPH